MKNIYLIGFMGSGKSTAAAGLAKGYGLKTVEMDESIVQREGRSINSIFAEEGEEGFRRKETELVRELSRKAGLVVSCGGGCACRQENVDLMKQSGMIVLLKASPETVYERVKDSTSRPLLNGNMNVEYIKGLMEKRRAMYEAAADAVVETDGRSSREICREIAALAGLV